MFAGMVGTIALRLPHLVLGDPGLPDLLTPPPPPSKIIMDGGGRSVAVVLSLLRGDGGMAAQLAHVPFFSSLTFLAISFFFQIYVPLITSDTPFPTREEKQHLKKISFFFLR